METKEYGDKVSALGITTTNIEHGVARLAKAVELLEKWQETTPPLTRDGTARTIHTAAWPTLDEINGQIERYWAQRREVADAWKELSEETRNTLAALGVKPPEE